MQVQWITGFLDSPSRAAEPFWLAATGTTLSPRRDGGTFATLLPEKGDAFLRVQVIGSGSPSCHLDLHVFDVAAGVAEALQLGAVELERVDGLVVLRSPAGIVFCLVTWHGETAVPEPVTWPGGHRSAVDQLALDVPVERFEQEADFWARLTGWPRRRICQSEFDVLEPPPGLPVRFLVQRIVSGAAGVHLDFACDDAAAEVERHVSLGAQVVRRVPDDWTTLLDPLGRAYCVTRRRPAQPVSP